MNRYEVTINREIGSITYVRDYLEAVFELVRQYMDIGDYNITIKKVKE